jgi:hypothetical protein
MGSSSNDHHSNDASHDGGHGHATSALGGPHHPVVPGSIGNAFEDRYWPAKDNVYRPPTIPRTTHVCCASPPTHHLHPMI